MDVQETEQKRLDSMLAAHRVAELTAEAVRLESREAIDGLTGVVVITLMWPLFFIALWVLACAAVAWGLYLGGYGYGVSVATVFAMQVLAYLGLRSAWRRFAARCTFPVTRSLLHRVYGVVSHG